MLGDIVSIEASEHIPPYHGAFFMRDWRRYERYSGSFMLEKCCHDLDLYNGVIGCRPERVASFGGRKSFMPANDAAARGHQRPRSSTTASRAAGWARTRCSTATATSSISRSRSSNMPTASAMTFHTNLNVPDDFRRFAVMGAQGHGRGRFRPQLSSTCTTRDRRQGGRQASTRRPSSRSTTAPTSRWRADIARPHAATASRCRSRWSMRWKPASSPSPWTRRARTRSVVDLTPDLGALRRGALAPGAA